jgi:hypothetical protein
VARSKFRRPPELVDFVAGYPGPPETQYHGGSVDVVAALIYKDGVRIDWRMRSMPDISWLPIDEEEKEIPDLRAGQRALRRVTAFWEQGVLFDDRGNEFQRAEYRNGMSIKGGWQGELAFFCSVPPIDGGALTLRIGDLAMVVPFDSGAERGVRSEPRFLAGYPGPPSAFPFHGGGIKVIAALLYTDKVVFEWLVRPMPDLSWIPSDEEQITRKIDRQGGKHREKLASMHRESKRLDDLWRTAVVADDRGTQYGSSTGGGFTIPGGHKGENAFSPGPPANAHELNLTMDELSVVIPLGKK